MLIDSSGTRDIMKIYASSGTKASPYPSNANRSIGKCLAKYNTRWQIETDLYVFFRSNMIEKYSLYNH